ncbi:phosphopantothenoylcysteine decarboxylase, partial [Streptomonospora algeriensis]
DPSGTGLDAEGTAAEVVDAGGRLVTPGLVDMHTHIWHGATYWGLDPDPVAWRTGVTTWVDAGSAGAYSMDGLRRFAAEPARVRVHALINVSALGLVAETGEHRALENLDLDAATAVAARHGDFVRGVKARIDARTVGTHGLEPLHREAALARSGTADAVVMAAAVADFRPAETAAGKIKKTGEGPAPVELAENPDILLELCAERARPGQVVVGFAAETDDVLANGRAKLKRKGCDLLVVNQVGEGRAFGTEDNQAVVLGADGSATEIPNGPKEDLADRVWDLVAQRTARGETAP